VSIVKPWACAWGFFINDKKARYIMSVKTKQAKKPRFQFDLFIKKESELKKEFASKRRFKYEKIGRENEPWYCDLTTFWEV